MTMSIAAKHAKGKSAQDKIFGANAAAVAAAAKYGKDAVTNATIGAILDEDEKLVCLPTVEEVFRGLSTNEMIAYAPISGLPEYLDCVRQLPSGRLHCRSCNRRRHRCYPPCYLELHRQR